MVVASMDGEINLMVISMYMVCHRTCRKIQMVRRPGEQNLIIIPLVTVPMHLYFTVKQNRKQKKENSLTLLL